MRYPLALLACTALLAGCASQPKDPSGIWINQAAIDAAAEGQSLREALMAYGPNLEWQIDGQRGTASYSNGFELGEGQLVLDDGKRWRVDFYGDYHEYLRLKGGELLQEGSEAWPEQRFTRAEPPAGGTPPGSRFESALYAAYLGGDWLIREGQGKGGLVRFHADGRLEGLPGADRYALCLAGDCASMSGENDALWLQLGEQGREWLFRRDGDTLEILEARNRAQFDEMPDYHPGTRAWLLERD
ncbi:hypothetical protein BZL41_14185 [Pseudomonas sp. PIC25]|uniref:hypothetical protein n=1 Tax=Pseudomonas sp. PIC25 TaxID=1958773 RepID=UPI000BABF3C8|nr:hypothetical protein [Pseudomonas sp. PIC25]PAU61368.1 hypothetical protein BZL41_14185 [Pseudomonas sp. PIC25]